MRRSFLRPGRVNPIGHSAAGRWLTSAAILAANTLFGVVFGWLFLKQRLESAILAHFMVDAAGGAIVPLPTCSRARRSTLLSRSD